MDIIDTVELRKTFAAIVANAYGKSERYRDLPDAICGIRVSVVENAQKLVEEHEALKARCTCGAHHRQFEPDPARETPAYRAMEQARIDRLLEVDEQCKRSVL